MDFEKHKFLSVFKVKVVVEFSHLVYIHAVQPQNVLGLWGALKTCDYVVSWHQAMLWHISFNLYIEHGFCQGCKKTCSAISMFGGVIDLK